MSVLFKNGYVYNSRKKSFGIADIMAENSKISGVYPTGSLAGADFVVDLTGKYVLPGLIDAHTHGRSGVDFNCIDDESVKRLRRSYAEAGTTTVMATLASADFDSLLHSIDVINRNRAPGHGMANIAGIHLEGRYLNPNRLGAHNPDYIAPLDADELEKLLIRMLPLPIHISAAFELDTTRRFIKKAREYGATCSLAHSDATYDEAVSAVDSGVGAFTHTYNAMRPIKHRDPGNMIASLLTDRAYSEFICDGFHSDPAMIELAYRAKPHDKTVLVTDSLEAAGCPEGMYAIAGLPVRVKNGRAVNSNGALAGSLLDSFTAMRNFARFTGAPVEEVIPMVTENPARMLGIYDEYGSIDAGKSADFLVLDKLTDNAPESVYIGGEKI